MNWNRTDAGGAFLSPACQERLSFCSSEKVILYITSHEQSTFQPLSLNAVHLSVIAGQVSISVLPLMILVPNTYRVFLVCLRQCKMPCKDHLNSCNKKRDYNQFSPFIHIFSKKASKEQRSLSHFPVAYRPQEPELRIKHRLPGFHFQD